MAMLLIKQKRASVRIYRLLILHSRSIRMKWIFLEEQLSGAVGIEGIKCAVSDSIDVVSISDNASSHNAA